MICLWSAGLVAPITSYANSGGTGNRTGIITVSATAPVNAFAGTLNNLVDGGFAANASDSTSPLGTATTGQYVRFDFGTKKYIDEVKSYYNNGAGAPNNGTWKWRGSNDASNWTDLASFTWNQLTQVTTLTGMDLAGYLYYQMEITANHVLLNDWWEEVEFKIADGAT